MNPEDISEIPPELLKKLNITPSPEESTSDIPPEVLAKLHDISGANSSGEEPGGFSWAALVYGPFYYWAMKDRLFAGLSVVASLLVYTLPLLIPLAFFARKRAWNFKQWKSAEEFWQTQRRWDRSAIIGGVVSILFLYFISRFIFSTLSSSFGSSDPNTILKQVQEQYQE